MFRIALLILFSTAISLGVAATSHLAENHADIRGKITDIRRASSQAERRMIGIVSVEAEDGTTKVDKANLIITDKTRILKEQGDKRVPATFDEFKSGQLIEAQFVEGPTIMIYPLQVAAAEVVILNTRE